MACAIYGKCEFANLTVSGPFSYAFVPSRVDSLELLGTPVLGETLYLVYIQQITCTRRRIIQDRVTSMKLKMRIVWGEGMAKDSPR